MPSVNGRPLRRDETAALAYALAWSDAVKLYTERPPLYSVARITLGAFGPVTLVIARERYAESLESHVRGAWDAVIDRWPEGAPELD